MDRTYTVVGKDDAFFGSFTFRSPPEAIAKAKELIEAGVRHVAIHDKDEEYSLDRFREMIAKQGRLG